MTHDYTKRHWSHDYTFDPIEGGLRAKMSGFGVGVSKGDYIIIENRDSDRTKGSNDTTRYQVESISYCADPKDMWYAMVTFAPREQHVS